MQKEKKAFLIFIDMLKVITKLSNEQAGIFIKTVLYFQENGELPNDIDFTTDLVIVPFVNQWVRDEESYKSVIEKRRVAGAKGGKQKVANVANATSATKFVANVADNDNDNEKVNDNENKKEKNKETIISSASPLNENLDLGKEKKERKKVAPKKESETTEHWASIVELWMEFNEHKFKFKPTFEGKDANALKNIVSKLRHRATERGQIWDKETAIATILKFLTYCYQDDFIKSNFLLTTINSQFDKIIINATNGTAKKPIINSDSIRQKLEAAFEN
jgi:hypothetical protein